MVGSHLLTTYYQKHHGKFCACRWRSPVENINHLNNRINHKDRVELDYLDLADYTSIYESLKRIKPDYIFHLAAQSFPKASFHMRETTYNTNILGTERLLYAVTQLKIKPIIHVCSSSEVFGRVSKKDLPISEKIHFTLLHLMQFQKLAQITLQDIIMKRLV